MHEVAPEATIPSQIEDLVGVLLAKKPEDRYPTAIELADALSALLAHQTSERARELVALPAPSRYRGRLLPRLLWMACLVAMVAMAHSCDGEMNSAPLRPLRSMRWLRRLRWLSSAMAAMVRCSSSIEYRVSSHKKGGPEGPPKSPK